MSSLVRKLNDVILSNMRLADIVALHAGDHVDLSFRSTTKFVLGAGDEEANDDGDGQGMPGALVMLRVILIMVGRKLSRNPNTYSSILGLLWSLIAFK